MERETLQQSKDWEDYLHINASFLSILTEEVGEAAKAINENLENPAIMKELIQIAAVAKSWYIILEQGEILKRKLLEEL